jgi:hypothetical protein
MIGFINIIRYTQEEFTISDGFDLEQLILLKRENNLQFDTLGEPVTKFVYYDADTKEYNAIFLYSSEQGMIDQHVDYLTTSSHTNFPDEYNVSKYGPLDEFESKIRPITVPNDLVRKMRASLELGYIKFVDESSFDALVLGSATKFETWAVDTDVDKVWTDWEDESITKKHGQTWVCTSIQDFEYLMYETRGMQLNIPGQQITSLIPYGVEYYEDDLKAVISASKTATFSSDFFSAITALGVTVDSTQF